MRGVALVLIAYLSIVCSAVAKEALTVADAIQATRLHRSGSIVSALPDSNGRYERLAPGTNVFVSPDGRKYALFLVSGDIERNGVRMEVKVGSLESLHAAANLRTVAQLFTNAEGNGTQFRSIFPARLLFSFDNTPEWLSDSEHIVMRWVDEQNVIQVIAINTSKASIEYLTHHPSDVKEYAVYDGTKVLYSADPLPEVQGRQQRLDQLKADGFAVQNQDLYSLLAGNLDGRDMGDVLKEGGLWAVDARDGNRRQIDLGKDGDTLMLKMRVSPDGRKAILLMKTPVVPKEWERYTEPTIRSLISEVTKSPNGEKAVFLRGYFLLDVEAGTARPLWNAPATTMAIAVPEVWWSPNSSSVLIAPAFLPIDDADQDGLNGIAAIEVNVANGSASRLPAAGTLVNHSMGLWRWDDENTIATFGASPGAFKKRNGQWRAVRTERSSVRDYRHDAHTIRIEVRESENLPPTISAIDTRTGAEQVVLDVNANIRDRFTLGHVEVVEWKDRDGRVWHGRLHYPVGYRTDVSYPFVIQTHGVAAIGKFSLYGDAGFESGPAYGINAAQPLANRGIAVLQMEDTWDPAVLETSREADTYLGAYEAAIDKWVASGLAAADKIGLTGFSRTGWHVSYALTHSAFPIAAAVIADNMDTSYLQRIASVAEHSDLDTFVGAPPVGDGLKVWLEKAPGFNTDRIRAALQIQSHSLGLVQAPGFWEIFSNMKRLGKPSELFFIADADHGSHGIQNPRQCLSAQERAVDWLDFWLTGHEDLTPRKQRQYDEWVDLRKKARESVSKATKSESRLDSQTSQTGRTP